jgi:hydrogenase maturation protein HypF
LPTVLACGAWLKNTACLLQGDRPVWSAMHGDLSDPAACDALKRSLSLALHGLSDPFSAVAHDLHPDFFSTHEAVRLAAELGVPAIGVQHHHAHIAAVLAEHGMRRTHGADGGETALEIGPVIGLALDGVGLGTDGTAWGGELLWVDGANCQRLGHLTPLALPGGDRAAREPWRMTASALHALGRNADITPRFAPVVGHSLAAGVQQMLARGLNCPPTSSAGRWFDAAAGALGLCVRQTEEAEAAIALEQAASRALLRQPDLPPLAGATIDSQNRLDLSGLVPHLLAAQASGNAFEVDAAAAGFHLALADALADWAHRAARQHGCATVCLGGGCFFNRILCERVTARLQSAGLAVLRPQAHSCGDAGLALGQAWVAQRVCMATASQANLNSRLHPNPMKEPEPCV